MDILKTDVLVIGSGLSGLYAAILCREKGFNVHVCSKNSPGLGNCTVVSQGIFSNSMGDFSRDDHRKKTLAAGHGINDLEKVALLVDHGERAIRTLKKYGVKLEARPGGLNSVSQGFGKEGASITKPLVAHARTRGVEFLYPFFAWDVIRVRGQIGGVWGFFKNGSQPVIILAKAVILAAGGGGALFSRTDNPPGITGDGYAMAYRAGLPLVDMEFVQFYPLSTAHKGKPNLFLPSILAEVGDLVNDRGEKLVEKYQIVDRPLAVASRDALSRAMALEVFNGCGIDGAVRFELGNFEKQWQRAASMAGRADHVRLKTWIEGLLGKRGSLLVMPVSHFFMGGVATDKECRTELPGLFAAGEAAGGLHGANRLGGNALSEAAVFGEIAGREAAAHAGEREIEEDGSVLRLVEICCKKLFSEDGNGDSKGLKNKIQNLMWDHAGLIRSRDSLQYAREILRDLHHNQVKISPLFSFLELKNMLLVAEMIVGAALMRKESRGSHFRIDYPVPDDSFLGHSLVQKDKGGMMVHSIKRGEVKNDT